MLLSGVFIDRSNCAADNFLCSFCLRFFPILSPGCESRRYHIFLGANALPQLHNNPLRGKNANYFVREPISGKFTVRRFAERICRSRLHCFREGLIMQSSTTH